MRCASSRLCSLACAVCVLLGSCDLLRDAPFEVVSWSPGVDRVDPESAEHAEIRLVFSADPDRNSVEAAFSLTEDGRAVRGAFDWQTRRIVRFLPYAALRANREYRLSLDASARGGTGVSLESAFEAGFHTRESDERPRVTSVLPPDGAAAEEERPEIALGFSSPVEAAAFRDHVSIEPALSGAWIVDGSGLRARFRPAEALRAGADYRVEVDADLVGRNGLRAGRSFASVFRGGADRTPPALVRAEAVDPSGAVRAVLLPDEPDDGAYAENRGWEASWGLRLVFSEEVDLAGLEYRLQADGGPALERLTAGDRAAEVRFRATEAPVWGERFMFRVGAGVADGRGNASDTERVYRIAADGSASRPPRLAGVRFPLAPGGADAESCEPAVFSAEEPFASLAVEDGGGRYPFGSAVPTRVELYFALAEGARLDRFALMEHFRVEATNGALAFSPRAVKTGDFFFPEPHPAWSEYARAEIEGYLTNRPESGVVSFVVAAGFRDSSGNEAKSAFVVPLLK